MPARGAMRSSSRSAPGLCAMGDLASAAAGSLRRRQQAVRRRRRRSTAFLDIYEGEFFALLGPSGCGKTTLLRMLAGFERPSEGRILLDGEDISGVPPHRRPVNMMFQSYALFPHLTVAGNIAFGLRQEELPKAEIGERVGEMLALVQLEGFGERKPHQLSGGQRQRVALARALVKRPRVLLLDEPLSALDRKLREETRFELMELQKRLGLTFIIVTHDQEEAMTRRRPHRRDERGRLAQVATPARDLRAAELALGRGLHRRCQPDRRPGRDVRARPSMVESAAGGRLRSRTADVAPGTPCLGGGAAGEDPDRHAGAPRRRENCVRRRVIDIGYLGDMSVYKVKLDNGLVHESRGVEPRAHGRAADRCGRPRLVELCARRRRGADQ